MEAQLKKKLGDDLWQACTEGQIDAMTSIILQRQSTDAAYDPPFSGMLHAATLRDRANIVSYCLERGATVNDSILQALAGASSFQTHKVLIQTNTIDINYYIPWWGPVLAVVAPDEDYEWVKFCLENGANANFNRVDEYKTVLGAAAENGRMDVVQLLLDHGATVQGSGAIVLAAEAGNKEVVALLLERGADVNEVGVADPTDPRVGEDMGSALHKAVAASHEDVVELLVGNGADVGLEDAKGRTPLDLAREKNRTEILELLQDRKQYNEAD